MWTIEDAVNLAIDMYNNGEIKFSELDKVATELWQEMQSDNQQRTSRAGRLIPAEMEEQKMKWYEIDDDKIKKVDLNEVKCFYTLNT